MSQRTALQEAATGLLGEVVRSGLDLAMGAPRLLNHGPASGTPDLFALKRSLPPITSTAFDESQGRVDYARLAKEPGCRTYQAASLRFFEPASLSAREIPRLGFFRQAAYPIGGELFSLDDIEPGILRGNQRHSEPEASTLLGTTKEISALRYAPCDRKLNK